ncbi:MAG TPA: DUF2255 family protein [Chloroflexota bacterium]|nr:DUF2255 family protein [Chloroflexota bacterium]
MAEGFGREMIEELRRVEEVEIETRAAPGKPARRRIIWVVVANDEVYVRSVRGTAGRWYRDLLSHPTASLRVSGRDLAVRAVPVTDAATIARVSAAYLSKYEASPHAPPIVREEVLSTTLRLEPA